MADLDIRCSFYWGAGRHRGPSTNLISITNTEPTNPLVELVFANRQWPGRVGGGPRGGAWPKGWGGFAPEPVKVPVVVLLPPKPV